MRGGFAVDDFDLVRSEQALVDPCDQQGSVIGIERPDDIGHAEARIAEQHQGPRKFRVMPVGTVFDLLDHLLGRGSGCIELACI